MQKVFLNYVTQDILKGQKIDKENIRIIHPGYGLSLIYFKKIELKYKYNEKLCVDCYILLFKTRNKINNQRQLNSLKTFS